MNDPEPEVIRRTIIYTGENDKGEVFERCVLAEHETTHNWEIICEQRGHDAMGVEAWIMLIDPEDIEPCLKRALRTHAAHIHLFTNEKKQ